MISKKYDFKTVEKDKYNFWLKRELFTSGKDLSKTPFTIVLPPPNVTGKLHIGHALDTTIPDIIIRRKRMQGYDCLFLPGTDHAGIATQAKVDQKLKEQGLNRYIIGREKFLEEAFKWKDEYHKHILSQWAALGISLDYSKERFTLDEGLQDAVKEVFIKLYNKGLIYKANRIINWDPEAKTALSNIEVEYKEMQGHLYYIKYFVKDSNDYLTVATTRPETLFADQAVMVNPNDERYKKYHGKTVILPILNKEIPIILDDYVSLDFGSGAVKVTPAHDPNDFEVGLRHNLDMPSCMNEDGSMNEMALGYAGLSREECRLKLIKDLSDAGLLIKKEEITHSVGFSERTGKTVEPRLSLQWFVKMNDLAKAVIENKEYRFIPARYKNVLVRWMENCEDWCISRQLWWGHRIPAWYKGNEMVVSATCPGDGFVQDENVLDTWFSSALWPFATLGWPNDNKLLERYYPTNLLVTGYDIIFFWVSRMLFQGIEFTNKAPFKDIYIHGLVRDHKGRKMSKSLGNGIDPFEIINNYGCDSLRYFLNTNSAAGYDFRFDHIKVEAAWNYLNKIWNISRYIILETKNVKCASDLSPASLYIINEYNLVLKEFDLLMDKYEISEAYKLLYNFVWNNFAAWYLELTKVDIELGYLEQASYVLRTILLNVLKLLHPICPFITEEIYHLLTNNTNSLMEEGWASYIPLKYSDKEYFETFKELVTSVRNLKAECKRPISYLINDIYLDITDKDEFLFFSSINSYMLKFLNVKNVHLSNKDVEYKDSLIKVVKNIKYSILESDLVDKDQVIKDLLLEKKRLDGELKRSNNILNNPNFLNKASKEKVEEEKNKLDIYLNQYDKVTKHLKKLGYE